MSCDDPVIYSCFREAQQNPDGDVATILNEIKEAIISDNIALFDGCDDLSDYADAWYELSKINPNDIQLVSDKLDQLGDDYWIQTLENADTGVPIPSYPYPRWWDYNPSVNMDFFGVTIEVLPNNENTGSQFTPEEFLNFIQLNFSTVFMGEVNKCGPYFEFISPDVQTNWTDGKAVSTVFTIHMADGNVIASEHVLGEYWIFSTLNAPGWLEEDSWDGYHPVSGNRRFGLLQNSDGTNTFYTSGVDRLTGWWHALADASPFVDAFDDADKLWACVMGLIADFVNQNGGTASSDFDCTTVRPKWSELRNVIKQGCNGLIESIDDFPCEQAEPCQ